MNHHHPMQLSDDEYFYKIDNMITASYEKIRRIFEARWKKETGKDWKNNEQQAKIFIEGLGFYAYDKADPIQKGKIATGLVKEWDLCILSLILQNMGDRNSYRIVNNSVRRLTSMRNGLAHHSTRKLTQQDYQGKLNVFRKSLLQLGALEEEIEEIIKNSAMSSCDAAFKMVKKLYDKAREKMAKNNFEKAIERCNEALDLPSLLPEHLAVAYENRAECYLKFAIYKREHQRRMESEPYIDQAIKDSTHALKLKDNSWKAYYVIGKCHKLRNQFEVAVEHLTKAVAISPVQQHVKNELASCKYDKKLLSTEDHLNPNLSPVTLKQSMARREEITGQKITKKQFLREWKELQTVTGAVSPGEEDVLRGLDYRSGVGVTPNNEEAVRLFSKAAEAGNPEGMLELGCRYLDGIGVKRDPSKALEYFQKTAAIPLDTPGQSTRGLDDGKAKNVGVVRAQFKLGVMYSNGIAVQKDHFKGAKWYKMAAGNGDSFAATNLGTLYSNGLGVPESPKMAENYYYQALVFGNLRGASNLANHYLNNLEPDKAKAMFEMSINFNPLDLWKPNEDEFKDDMEKIEKKRDRYEADVVNFEQEYNLDIKGLTFLERRLREIHANTSEPMLDKLARITSEVFKTLEGSSNKTDLKEEDINVNVKSLGSRAKEGSLLATRILETRNIHHNLVQLVQDKDNFSSKQKTKVINLLYQCTTLEFDTVSFKTDVKNKLKAIVDDLFNSKRKNESDQRIRFLYILLNYGDGLRLNTDNITFELIKEGIRMYPNNVHYYELLCEYYAKGSPETSLSLVEKGLKKFPNNVKLLCHKAFLLDRLLFSTCRNTCSECRCCMDIETGAPKKKMAVLEAYQQFLKKAPKDHKDVPNAYYRIALVHMIISSDFMQMEYYYRLGKEAEKYTLSCHSYLYDERWCIEKKFVETVISESKTGVHNLLENKRLEYQQKQQALGILERKVYLDAPVRRWMLTTHRRRIKGFSRNNLLQCTWYQLLKGKNGFCSVPRPTMPQSGPERMDKMRSITLREINPVADFLYENRVIDMTIIDVLLVDCYCPGIHLMVEDNYGDVARLNIYNIKNCKEDMEELELGAKIAILNPCMQTGITEVEDNGIRIDDPHCIVLLGKVENMCRFCGEGVDTAHPLKCAKCKTAVYCSKECQEHDWKIMKHKLICSSN